MGYTAKTRDRYRLAVAAVSGVTTFGALTATGFLAGAAAKSYQADQDQKAAEARAAKVAWKQQQAAVTKASKQYAKDLADAWAHPHVVTRERKHTSTVITQYVGGGSGYVGSGGSVSYGGGSSSGGSGGGSGSGGSGGGGGGTTAPPPPPPAPSSGS